MNGHGEFLARISKLGQDGTCETLRCRLTAGERRAGLGAVLEAELTGLPPDVLAAHWTRGKVRNLE